MRLGVLLADDHVMVREGLRALLERAGIRVVGEAADGREAVRLAEQLHPDVAVVDLSMPLLNGLDASRAILRSCATTKVVLLTMHPDRRYLVEAVRAGVTGYILKTRAADDLVKAVQEVSQGAIYLGPQFSRDTIRVLLTEPNGSNNRLTVREREVLQLVAEGNSTKQIAVHLGISVKTAESHRTRVMKKLDIHDAPTLARYAIREGIIQP